ncbi:MAG: hypothetical protein EBU81_16005, partial [Proteobacteria bacterium]|nr:hypothetical protein [Pseudomonadota bacterium]
MKRRALLGPLTVAHVGRDPVFDAFPPKPRAKRAADDAAVAPKKPRAMARTSSAPIQQQRANKSHIFGTEIRSDDPVSFVIDQYWTS